MPLFSAAVCPHPPVLIPEIAAGAAGELDDLRQACDAAVAELVGGDADTVILVGAGDRTTWLPANAYATFTPFGVSIEFSLPTAAADLTAAVEMTGAVEPTVPRQRDARLPLSLAVGAWLLARQPRRPPVEAVSVAHDAGAADCAAVAAAVASRPGRVALLVMGDGSAYRGRQASEYDDPRAGPYDDRVARALVTADTAVLSTLDPLLSAELRVAGRAPWQVLAGCAGAGWRGRLSYYAAPYGVAYFVARWDRP